jgi:hypothetical protein
MMNTDTLTQNDTLPGQAVYTRFFLKFYDFCVLGISNHFIWKCPTKKILSHYNQLITGNHLEIGVGTGYYLDNCAFPVKSPRVVLGDLNPNCLQKTSQRIQRYFPASVPVDVLKPLTVPPPGFDSIAVNYVLHCLPGTMEDKGKIFSNIKELMNPNGIIFGSTILFGDVRKSGTAEKLMRLYNSKKIFSNENDSLGQLKKALELHFSEVKIEVVGCVALFSAKK